MKVQSTSPVAPIGSWTRYATVIGGLAAANTAAPAAEAAVIYTDVIPDMTMSTVNQNINFDLDQSGAAPYVFLNTAPAAVDFQLRSTGSTDVTTAVPFGATGRGQIAGYYILKLGSGATIDSSLPWNSGVAYFEFFNTGNWQGGGDGYIGLRIQNGANFNYGWAHLFYDDANNTMTLKEFAYQATANTPIASGQIPEPSAALLLALGAGGAMMRRNRAKRVA